MSSRQDDYLGTGIVSAQPGSARHSNTEHRSVVHLPCEHRDVQRPQLGSAASDPFPTIMIDGKVRMPLLHFLYDAARRQRCGTVTRFRSAWRSRTARGIACTAALTAQTGH